ncbi:transposase [Streptomyces sp. NPDC042638]|uniref:transposase n=1 Tax=Streptomyces sp. NPDC042638 TaxID=3154333 RepID=UPI0033EF9589
MARWAAAGVIGLIRDQLRKRIRREMGKAPGAVATVIDSQSIKAAETVGKDFRGYDAGKKINGRRRHLVVDTKGLPQFVMVTPADMTDRNAAKEVLFRLRLMHPEITIVWADSAYAGQLVTWAQIYLNLTIKTVSRPKDASGFVVLPPALGRRTFTRLGHARPSTRARLRAAHPALGIAHHLGRDHPHDPGESPAEAPAGADSQPPARPNETDHPGPDGEQCHQEVTGPGSRP